MHDKSVLSGKNYEFYGFCSERICDELDFTVGLVVFCVRATVGAPAMHQKLISRAMSQATALVWIFGECSRVKDLSSLLRCKFDILSAYCRALILKGEKSKQGGNDMKRKTLRTLGIGTALTLTLAMGSMANAEEVVTEAAEENGTEAVTEAAEVETEAVTEEAEDETEAYTGDASLDDPRNQDEIGEKELLVVSFGTSFNDSRRETIGAIEGALAEAFPDYSVRRAFTSQIIIDHVMERDGVAIDNMTQALDRAVENGVKTLVVQPTHLMNGLEYEEMTQTLAEYADVFEQVAVGEPLLISDEDFAAVEKAITDATAEYVDGETAIVFMGHGTEADSNQIYGKMQENLTANGFTDYYIGTVEATPSLEDVIAKVGEGEYKKVVLLPLMIVAGDHANNDMAVDWKASFEEAGYEVEVVLQGLGANEGIQQLLVDHAQAAVDSLAQ